MAINNHSNNPPCVFKLIVKFDKLKTDIQKKGFIHRLKSSEVKFCREMAVLLKKRMQNPPPPIPDKTVFIANLDLMDKEKLKMFCDDLRFLLATKYFTV
jgi:hypothetical protein